MQGRSLRGVRGSHGRPSFRPEEKERAELGHRVRQCTGEVKARAYLLQCLSVAIQRGNAASVLGSVGGQSEPDLFSM